MYNTQTAFNTDVSLEKGHPDLSDNNLVIQNVRPWVRFFARQLDYLLFAYLVVLLMIFKPTLTENLPELTIGILAAFIWIFIETILLNTWGTTPGKWLMKIKIQNQQEGKPKFFNLLRRSLKVWFRGNGVGFPIISLFTCFFAYKQLMREGVTTWDKDEGFIIIHEKIGFFRILIGFLIVLLYFFSVSIGSVVITKLASSDLMHGNRDGQQTNFIKDSPFQK